MAAIVMNYRNRCSMLTAAILTCSLIGCGRDESHSNSKLASKSVTFGQRQLAQLLDDRPSMQDAIPADHPIRDWIATGFDGRRLGQRIFWNATEPAGGADANHAPPFEGYPPFVSMTNKLTMSPVDQWASIAFELTNIENTRDFGLLDDQAIAGTLKRNEYANACVALEFQALERARDLFAKYPLPSNGESDVWYHWVTTDLGTFEQYQQAFNIPGMNGSNSNFDYFGDYYDSALVPYRSYQQATELAP